MLFRCTTKKLRAAFAQACLVPAVRSLKAHPSHFVLLEGDARGCFLRSTSGKAHLTIDVSDSCRGDGQILLPKDRIARMIDLARSDEITIRCLKDGQDGGMFSPVDRSPKVFDQVEVRGPSTSWKFAWDDPIAFPTPDVGLPADHVATPAASLARLIDQTAFATDPESTRFALQCVLFEHYNVNDSPEILLVATDGRRLCRAVAPCRREGDNAPFVPRPNNETHAGPKPLIPVEYLKILGKLARASDADDVAAMGFLAPPSSAFVARIGRYTWAFPLGEGRFPRYEDVFPHPSTALGRISWDGPEELARAIALASVVTDKERRTVAFHAGRGIGVEDVVLHANIPDSGASTVAVPGSRVDLEQPYAMAFMDDYFLEGIEAIAAGTPFHMEVYGPNVACKISAPGFDYVLMPLTADAGELELPAGVAGFARPAEAAASPREEAA